MNENKVVMNPIQIRKKVGCWACRNSITAMRRGKTKVGCNHPDEEIRKNFKGYKTADCCKGFALETFRSVVTPGKDNNE